MEEESEDIIVIGAIKRGAKKFEKIRKITQIDSKKLNTILEKLEERGMIEVQEKKGFLVKKLSCLLQKEEPMN